MSIRVGIIGTGGIAHCHADSYKRLGDRVELVACCDLDEGKCRRFADRYGFQKTYTDCHQMLAENKLDCVSVCTWNSAHAPCTIAALDAGCNVLCEKPMAMSAAEGEAMKAAADRNGKLLMLGFVRRHGNDAATALDFIQKGYLGDIYYSKVSYLRRAGCPGGWFGDRNFSGGGPLVDLGVHVIDLARYLMGRPLPVEVFGATFEGIGPRHNLKKGGGAWQSTTEVAHPVYNVEDCATAMIRFDNGAVLQVEASFNMYIKEDTGEIRFFGTKGGINLEPFTLYTDLNDMMVDIAVKGPTDCGDYFFFEVKNFVDSVEIDPSLCKAPAEDGVELMRILDAIYESAKTGKSVTIKR